MEVVFLGGIGFFLYGSKNKINLLEVLDNICFDDRCGYKFIWIFLKYGIY